MPRKKPVSDPLILRVPKGATRKQIYEIVKKNFTAADLAEYCNLDEKDWEPRDTNELLSELKAIHQTYLRENKGAVGTKAKAKGKRKK